MKYEELIPMICKENAWEVNENNHVIVHVGRKGFWQNCCTRIFGTEKADKKYEVELDDYGSYVWKKIDGKRSNMEIIEDIQRELGEEVNLASQRLVMFMHMLKRNKLIFFDKRHKNNRHESR